MTTWLRENAMYLVLPAAATAMWALTSWMHAAAFASGYLACWLFHPHGKEWP